MRNKRIISLIIITALVFSFFPASVYADTLKLFKDMKESDWFTNDVSVLYKLGIINGKPQKDGTVIFDPKGLVTKAEFTKMLVEAMGYELVDGNTFKDVGYDRHWAKKYIETAVKEGIINPDDEGDKFWPDIPIKRNDMAYMMFKALRLEPSDNKSPFPDVDIPFATKLHEEHLIAGVLHNGNIYFKADGLTTRAEAATVIARIVEYKENPKAYKEKRLWDSVTEDGVPMRLYLMDYRGKSLEVRREELFTQLNYSTPGWKNFSDKFYNTTPKELAYDMYETGKRYMEVEYNIDYRTIDKSYKDNIEPVISQNNWGKYIDYDIKKFKDNKIVLESKFYTAEDLLYYYDGGFYLRGKFKFKYSEPTLKSYLEKTKDINGNTLKIGQWYEQDVDVKVGGDPARVAYVIASRTYKINKPKPIN